MTVTYVRPILEYASCVWSPYTIGQVTTIEAVQRRFTKRLLCCCGMQYPERLAKLGVDSLESVSYTHLTLPTIYSV